MTTATVCGESPFLDIKHHENYAEDEDFAAYSVYDHRSGRLAIFVYPTRQSWLVRLKVWIASLVFRIQPDVYECRNQREAFAGADAIYVAAQSRAK